MFVVYGVSILFFHGLHLAVFTFVFFSVIP